MSEEKLTDEILKMDVMEIMAMVPHRYPFLLVDRITECVPGKYVKGYKNVSINEGFFNGHFPGNPVMPGVLQLEALAQCSGPLILTLDKYKGQIPLFASMDKVRFKKVVRPGDRFDMVVELLKLRGPIGKSKAMAYVDGEIAVEAEMTVCMKEGSIIK